MKPASSYKALRPITGIMNAISCMQKCHKAIHAACTEDTGQIFFEKDGLDPISKKGDQAAPSPAAGPDNTSGPSENDSSPNIDEDKKDEIVKDDKDDKDDNKPKSPVIVVPPMPEPTPMPAPT